MGIFQSSKEAISFFKCIFLITFSEGVFLCHTSTVKSRFLEPLLFSDLPIIRTKNRFLSSIEHCYFTPDFSNSPIFEPIFVFLGGSKKLCLFSSSIIITNLIFLFQVDWSEYWLIGLLMFHTVTFLCVLTTRKYTNFQVVLFLLLCKYMYQH